MSAIARRFLAAFGILIAVTAVLETLWLVLRWLMPGWMAPLPLWLPEDFIFGLGFQFLSDVVAWVPSLGLSALLLTCSYWLRPDELPKGETEALSRSSSLAAGASVVLAVVVLLAQPWVGARLDDLGFRYKQTRQLEDAFRTLKDKGAANQTESDLDSMLSLLKRLGVLRPFQGQQKGDLPGPQNENRKPLDYDFELQILRARIDLAEFFRLRALPGVADSADDLKDTVDQLLTKAETALAGEDREFQANLWGYSAYRRLINAADYGVSLDSALLDRAKTVVNASWDRIYKKTLLSDERKRGSYFLRKGKSLGDYQFQNYLEAYYGFQELHHENPNDAEVTQHETLAKQKLSGKVLFGQEMEVLFAVPGSDNLVFLNRDSPREVVRIGKLLNTSQGVFVKDFEFLRTNAKGEVLLHWTAPYGRWDDGIDFRVWNKEKAENMFPTVLPDTPPGNKYDPLDSVDPPKFIPRVTVRELEQVSSWQPGPQTLGTADLLVHGKGIEALGYNSGLFQTEFVARLGAPFAYFVAFILVFALGWSNRAHEGSRSWWLMVPILPLLTDFTVQTATWAARLVIGTLIAVFGLGTAAIILIAAFIVASVAGVIWLQAAFRRSAA